MKDNHLTIGKSNYKYLIKIILFVSLLLRLLLVLRGGQYFISDEQRYDTSQRMANLLLQGNVRGAGVELFQTPEHLGYKVIGLIPAFLEHLTGKSLILPAMFFSLFSVANLYLIYLLSQSMGASAFESLFVLVFASLSQTLFYYVRHYFPYDTAMTFGLLAFYVALAQKSSMTISVSCGVLAWLCFLTYNGYWALAGLALLVHVFFRTATPGDILRKGIFAASGFWVPFIGLAVCSASVGINLLKQYRSFAGTILEGNFAEGWSLPFGYFWYAEHLLFPVLGLLAIYAVIDKESRISERTRLWGLCILFLYVCLVIPSVLLHAFVVYGRLARQLIPFLILLSGVGLTRLVPDMPSVRGIAGFVLALVLIQASWNFKIVFSINFPRDFVRQVQTEYPGFNFSPKRFAFGAPEVCEDNGYAMRNAKYFLTAPLTKQAVQGRVLLSASHPINFVPYQYEGNTPEQRAAFQRAQLKMVFYVLDPDFAAQSNLKKNEILSCLTR